MKGEEKRREIRIFVSMPVIFHCEQDRSDDSGTMVDLSLGGMSMKASSGMNINDTVKIKFELPEGDRFIFLGKVVALRVEDGQSVYGVRFMKQDPVDRLNLSEYIMKKRSEQEFWIKDKITEG